MIFRFVPPAAAFGVAAAFALAAPAAAATTPTLSGPAQRTGYGTITLTGTAAPGAAVHLYETAIAWNDLQPADDWERGSGTVTATANSAGKYTIVRYLDTGFYFEVESGGVRSARITVQMKVAPTFWVTSPSAGTIQAHTDVSPNQEGLPVAIQQQGSGGTWTTVATGRTDAVGSYVTKITGVAGGDRVFRASVSADPSNGVLGNVSASSSTWVAGPGASPSPAAGSIQFTRIQYDSPGTDSGSTTSLNGEYAKLTNKTKSTVSLSGWSVRDAANHVYTFTGTVKLAAGASITVRTGKGTNTSTYRYWGRTGKSGYIWDNSADTATLRTNAGKTIDSCKWTKLGSGYTNC